MDSPALPPVTREPYRQEFVPADYFRRLRPGEVFGDEGLLEVDLGCGDGSFLVEMARAFPERRFLGVERLLGRVRKVCGKVVREGLGNVRVLRLESRYTVEWLLAAGSVGRLHLLCPDPWPKTRHQRRRLVQPEFVAAVARVLAPGGEWLFKSDDADYCAWVGACAAGCGELEPLDWPDGAFFYPPSDFERQWLAAGRTIGRLRWRKVGAPAHHVSVAPA
jgi:tRNA (guanine-N7-)-methyltransferase